MGYVYKITNTVNNKSYIGISVNEPTQGRIKKHLSGRGNRIIARAVKKYGKDVFTYEILAANVFDEFLPDLEVAYIANFNTVVPNGYNLTHGGDGAGSPSAEARRKMSEARKGKKLSAESIRKRTEAQKGKKRSAESIRKAAEANRGKKRSTEARRKISEALKGRTFSEEHRRKISEARKGKKMPPRTEEHCRKMSEANRGKNNPNFGKSASVQTRQKMSEAHRLSEYAPAHDFFLSLPPDMSLKEKRRLLYAKFPNVRKGTIYNWVLRWS